MVYQLHTACYILPTTYCLLVTTLWLTTVAGRTGCLEPSLAIFTSASVLVTFSRLGMYIYQLALLVRSRPV